MRRRLARIGAFALAAALAFTPAPSEAIAPILLLLVKQIVKDAAQSMMKDMILSSLRDMGCKGMALANALEAFDLRRGGGAGGLGMLVGGMPKMPAGMSMSNLPAGTGMPQMPPGMTMPPLPGGMSMPGGMALPGGMAMPGLPAGMAMPGLPGGGLGMAGMPPDVAAKMRELMPGAGQLPTGAGIDSEQMARVMQAMSQPLSPPETLAVIDEMAEVGFLPKAMQTELKECMVLLPAAIPALGMGMAMLKPVLPQLRQAREQMQTLSPAEQDEIGVAMVQEMKALPTSERKSLVEFLDSGFFPNRTSAAAKAALAAP